MTTVTYGPTVAVTVKPQEPTRRQPPPPVPAEARKAMNAARDDKNEKISARVEQWQAFTRGFAEDMSKDFGKTAEHFVHLLLSNMSSAKTSRKPNAYNAWSSKILHDANQGTPTFYYRVPLRHDDHLYLQVSRQVKHTGLWIYRGRRRMSMMRSPISRSRNSSLCLRELGGLASMARGSRCARS